MPLYEYECDACGKRFEIIQKFSDAPPEACRACAGGPVRRLMSSPAIQFKGSGWYITDYSQKGKPTSSENGDGAKSGEKDGQAGKEGKSGEAKSGDAKPAADGGTKTPSAPASTGSKTDAPA